MSTQYTKYMSCTFYNIYGSNWCAEVASSPPVTLYRISILQNTIDMLQY